MQFNFYKNISNIIFFNSTIRRFDKLIYFEFLCPFKLEKTQLKQFLSPRIFNNGFLILKRIQSLDT